MDIKRKILQLLFGKGNSKFTQVNYAAAEIDRIRVNCHYYSLFMDIFTVRSCDATIYDIA